MNREAGSGRGRLFSLLEVDGGVDKSWYSFFKQVLIEPYAVNIEHFLHREWQQGKKIFPPKSQIFSAFSLPFNQIKVVILGQDPYHGEGQAHGLAFSVKKGVKIPPSLRNIYKELEADITGFTAPEHGNLERWHRQGVFLLNTVLTVEEKNAHSHAKIGWETFTDQVIEKINRERDNIVFILWGSHAQKKGRAIDRSRHKVITSPHPSPLSAYRGFFGSKPFSECNAYLKAHQKRPIDWQN